MVRSGNSVEERRSGIERRGGDVGPPTGVVERRQRRQASDVMKPPCPWCGSSTSAVYRSKPSFVADDTYRRRRQCADCGRDWPTAERLDVNAFAIELGRRGVPLDALGLQGDRPAPSDAQAAAAGAPLVSWAEWCWRRQPAS